MNYNDSELTTESSQSHYGIPVLRLDGVDYGPSDILPNGDTASQLVIERIGCRGINHEDATAFCSQWPDGPQPKEAA